MLRYILLRLISFYQKAISPLVPARCRYYPTCSVYAKQALTWHGGVKGVLLAAKRILSCHPLGDSGVDFVPLPMASYNYQLSTGVHYVDFVHRDRCSYRARLNRLMRL